MKVPLLFITTVVPYFQNVLLPTKGKGSKAYCGRVGIKLKTICEAFMCIRNMISPIQVIVTEHLQEISTKFSLVHE